MCLNGLNIMCCSFWQVILALFMAHLFIYLTHAMGYQMMIWMSLYFSASIYKFLCVYMLQFHKL
jgi:hypothetical protein